MLKTVLLGLSRAPGMKRAVTAFPPTQEAPVEVEPAERHRTEAPSARLPGPDSRCPALAPIRLAAPHEAAR